MNTKLTKYVLRFWPQHGWTDASDSSVPFPRTDNVVYLAAEADALLSANASLIATLRNDLQASQCAEQMALDDVRELREQRSADVIALNLKDEQLAAARSQVETVTKIARDYHHGITSVRMCASQLEAWFIETGKEA